MAWNLPKDQQPNRPTADNPWTGGQHNPEQQPPHLEALLRQWWQKWRSGSPTPVAKKAPIKWFLALVVMVWALMGVHYVSTDHLAYVMRLGAYQGQLTPGWQWRAWGLYQVKILPQPMNLTLSTEVMTQDLNLTEVTVAMRYRINDPQAYLFTIQAPQDSLRALLKSALQQTMGGTRLEVLLSQANPPEVLNHLSHVVQTLTNQAGLGITVENISLQKVAIPTALQELFDKMDALYATQTAEKDKSLQYQRQVLPPAQVKAEALLTEAKAYSQQAQLKAQADVADFLALLPSYEKAPQLTKYRLYSQAMASLWHQAATVVVAPNGTAPSITLNNSLAPKTVESDPVVTPVEPPVETKDTASDTYGSVRGGYG